MPRWLAFPEQGRKLMNMTQSYNKFFASVCNEMFVFTWNCQLLSPSFFA